MNIHFQLVHQQLFPLRPVIFVYLLYVYEYGNLNTELLQQM